MQRVSICNIQWIVKILSPHPQQWEDFDFTITGTCFEARRPISMLNNLNIISEEDLVLYLLEIECGLAITYYTSSNQLTDVSVINI